MKESDVKEEDLGLAQYLEALDLDLRPRDSGEISPPKNRAGSAPPTFDSSSLFLYMEDDVYTRSFTKGFLNTRKDNLYTEFYEQYKHKHPSMPPPFFQEDFAAARDAKNGVKNVYVSLCKIVDRGLQKTLSYFKRRGRYRLPFSRQSKRISLPHKLLLAKDVNFFFEPGRRKAKRGSYGQRLG